MNAALLIIVCFYFVTVLKVVISYVSFFLSFLDLIYKKFFFNKVFVFQLEGPLKTSIFAEGFPSLKNFKMKWK